MIRIAEADCLEQIFHYQLGFSTPYFFPVDYSLWKKSFAEDIDGEGRPLFRQLSVKAAYDGEKLIGFIQYGRTAFGFDPQGEISSNVSYCVIRNLYFDPDRPDAGELLLQEAMDDFSGAEQVYAFFHYFGMSCFARHGKLFQEHARVEALLRKQGFQTEHENVYYSSVLAGEEASPIALVPHDRTRGDQQYIDFFLSGDQVGGCEVHFVNEKTAYLRWIYVNENITGQGIGTKCMQALKSWLFASSFRRFDTDTALANIPAQRYYEKNCFTREGVTRSFYRTESI